MEQPARVEIEHIISGEDGHDVVHLRVQQYNRELKTDVYGKPLTASGKRQTANFKLYFDVNS